MALTDYGYFVMLVAVTFKFFRQAWFQILIVGIVLFVVTEQALATTNNPNFFPAVILIGAFVMPVTFVTYFYEHVRDRDISMPLLTTCFIVGGLLGLVAAGFLEYGTLRSLSVSSLFAVGLIEESMKLIFPIVMFVSWKYRHEADGLLFGVAAGMGFAALETMGYALVSFIQSRGDLGTLQQVLLLRGLLSPAGHAAWTGLVCSALWRQRERTGHPFGLSIVGAFLLAVTLHGSWDVVNSINTQTPFQWAVFTTALLAIIGISLGLIIWRFRKARSTLGTIVHGSS